ncbi:MAG: L-threonylcarbamoyladenylate synthase [Planctomycetota bacterium]|jgi:protein-tyrosine phosphatase
MKTKVVKVDADRIDLSAIKEAAKLVDSGGLAAFPTETVYGIACRAESTALEKLDEVKGRGSGKYYTLHISEKPDVHKYLPVVGLRAQKLITKAWPGPLTIVFELDAKAVEKQQGLIDEDVYKNLYKDNSIGIRCPDNPVAKILLRGTKRPVVAPSANLASQHPATDGDAVLAQLADKIDLLLDSGPCKYKKSSTVVRIGKKGMEILRSGVYTKAEVETMSAVQFLFVCTGNSCRSPMAEGMFRKYLAVKLQCKVDQLDKIGYKVLSAGVMGLSGLPASPEAISACASKGVNIKRHKSRALSQQLVEESDFIYAMGQTHLQRIAAFGPEAASKCALLAINQEIADPIGQSQQVYNSCADLINEAIEKRISEFVI